MKEKETMSKKRFGHSQVKSASTIYQLNAKKLVSDSPSWFTLMVKATSVQPNHMKHRRNLCSNQSAALTQQVSILWSLTSSDHWWLWVEE